MRGIVGNVLYDTEAATLVAEGIKNTDQCVPPGNIYRTPNGRYFVLDDKEHIFRVDEDHMVDWIAQHSKLTDEVVKLLVEEFGIEIGRGARSRATVIGTERRRGSVGHRLRRPAHRKRNGRLVVPGGSECGFFQRLIAVQFAGPLPPALFIDVSDPAPVSVSSPKFDVRIFAAKFQGA